MFVKRKLISAFVFVLCITSVLLIKNDLQYQVLVMKATMQCKNIATAAKGE
jgi:hypothetical protein